jgi:hypothetical protein
MCLQPYMQTPLKMKGEKKLKPRSYGPYMILRHVGEVAYELDLLERCKIHNFFYVSCLKRALGKHITTSTELPPIDEEGKLILVPKEILESREQKLRNRTIKEYLVKWKDLPIEDATWEG